MPEPVSCFSPFPHWRVLLFICKRAILYQWQLPQAKTPNAQQIVLGAYLQFELYGTMTFAGFTVHNL
jgi:hypothetical protein